MAIEKDAGPGGEQPLVNGQVPPEVLIEELPQDPGIFEFDDGSAIVGEYAEEQPIPEMNTISSLGTLISGITDCTCFNME